MPDQRWEIDRYARFKSENSEDSSRSRTTTPWSVFDNSSNPMSLMLSDVHQLVISQGSTILESHSLLSARSWMRGVCRNDSLLFMCRIQISRKTEIRKFRVRFCADSSLNLSGSEQCKSCVQKLQQFFPLKTSVVKNGPNDGHLQNITSVNQEDGNSETQQKTLEGEVTLGNMAKNLLSAKQLPLIYTQHHVDRKTIQQMLRLCLADPAFPAFVGSVEEELKNITMES